MRDPHAFDFGENWANFSAHALDSGKVVQSAGAFRELVQGIDLTGRSFLDIGFGQGLGLLNAATLGARAVGCDINPKCAEVLTRNRSLYPDLQAEIPAVVGSILDPQVTAQLRALSGDRGFDIVHSWGVLHHTGDMATAIAHAAGLVAKDGHLIIAIYNRHWSSKPWWLIKRIYVSSPPFLQRLMIGAFTPIIRFAKWLVTGGNAASQGRGMDFHYDVIDWVGGYPYEYGSLAEIDRLVAAHGFETIRHVPAQVPTGCNEFVYRRRGF
jgi:SAM-dependent methyltransferase